jgi:hypothetical protein
VHGGALELGLWVKQDFRGVLGCCKSSVEEVTLLLLDIWLKSHPLEIGSAIKGWLKWACDGERGSVHPETSFLLPCRKRQ